MYMPVLYILQIIYNIYMKVTPVVRKAILQMYADGITIKDIASEIGVSKRTIYNVLKDEGIEVKKEKNTESEDKSIEKQQETGAMKQVVKHAVQRTKEELDDVYTIGDFVQENVYPYASRRGLTAEEYINKCVQFYEEYSEEVENLIKKVEELELTVNELTEYLKPFPYLFQSLIAMIQQGKVFTRKEILAFLYGDKALEVFEL